MLSNLEYINESLTIHLFFARIMKEHALFLQATLLPKNYNLIQQSNNFRVKFSMFLDNVVSLSNQVVEEKVLNSGEVVTPYTLEAELKTQYYTGININTNITQRELELTSRNNLQMNHTLEQKVNILNQKAISLITGLIQLKSFILKQVIECNIGILNYPLLVDHVIKEAKLYLMIVQHLQTRNDFKDNVLKEQLFWNNMMNQHARFIRGLLDPTEEALIQKANSFANKFEKLINETKEAIIESDSFDTITDKNIIETQELKEFKAQGLEGILDCEIKSMIFPLLSDHVLREANHYLRLLKEYEV